MKRTTLGLTALAGAAVFEAALIPGVLVGAAAVLAPKFLPKYFPKWRRRPPPSTVAPTLRDVQAEPAALTGAEMKRAFFKTLTFRTIVTSLDFTSNIIVIGELAPAAALSAYGLIAGPLFYFAHEMFWTRLRPSNAAIDVSALPRLRPGVEPPLESVGGFRMSRAMAKTITYRVIVTTTDFTANFVVVGDLAAAAGLTAFGFVVGPFVFYYHERVWDRFSLRDAPDPKTAKIPPAKSIESLA